MNRCIVAGIALFIAISLISCQSGEKQVFDQAEISTVKELPETHKQFIALFYANAVEANTNIMLERAMLINLRNDYKYVMNRNIQLAKLNTLAEKYRFGEDFFNTDISKSAYKRQIDTLLFRVDYIPEKLVMAQAIIESGWGSSRFSKEMNNYFGIHCHTPGCGSPPADVENPEFWVKYFSNTQECIEEYIWVLNTGLAFHELRKKRLELRNENNYPNARLLSQGLMRYSEQGSEYIELIQTIINNYLPENLDEFVKYINAGEPDLS